MAPVSLKDLRKDFRLRQLSSHPLPQALSGAILYRSVVVKPRLHRVKV
jgi:hypothetical protein